MKNVILAEPSTIALFGMGFVVLLFLMALVGAVVFLIVRFLREKKNPASPHSPIPPVHPASGRHRFKTGLLLLLLAGMAAVICFVLLTRSQGSMEVLGQSEFFHVFESNRIVSATITYDAPGSSLVRITGTYKRRDQFNNETEARYVVKKALLTEKMRDALLRELKPIEIREPNTHFMMNLIWSIIPFLILPLMVMLMGLALGAIALFVIRRTSKDGKTTPAPRMIPQTERMYRKCPQCGAELKPDVSEGLCPACLLQRGIATEGGAPPGTPPFVPPMIPDLAKLFPQLEILELIGKGGMGAVYKARQPALDRFVALKILAPRSGGDLDFAERFTREARALARLSHPNIVAVYDFGVAAGVPLAVEPGILPGGETVDVSKIAGSSSADPGGKMPPSTSGGTPDTTKLHYFIMEYVDGPNLRQIEQAGKLPPREALEIIPQICAALQFAHDEGIVHRDIKPENVLLDKKGRVKIADFGLAKILGQEPKDFRLTGARDVVGTPHYMAPEQIEKPQTVDHRADIYSLGVVFYEMLTGELPLGKFQPPSSCARGMQIDVRLDEVVLRSLEKEPARRYQHVSEVKTQVETIANSQGGSAANTGATPNPSPGRDYRTKQSLFGLPLAHVAWGVDPVTHRPRVAKGWIAIGSKAKGLAAVGLEAYGLIAVGLIAGGIFPTGLLAFGVWSVGLVAYGIVSTGLLAIALIQAVGLVSLGNHSVGLVHFGIDAPVFLLLGLPIAAIWFLRMICSTIKRAWQSAGQPAAATSPPPDRFWRRFALVMACVVLIPVAIAILGMLAAIAIPNFVKGRNQALAHRQNRAVAAQASETASNLAFGPVIEREINLADARTNFLITFKTGDLRTPPPEIGGSSSAIYDWARREGVDAGAGIINKDVLSGFDMAVLPAPARCWEELTPTQAVRRLDSQPLDHFCIMLYGNANLPDTCAFKTHEGGIGILQVTEYVSDPPGLKVRYKFLEKAPETPSMPATTESWSPMLWPGEKPDLQKVLDEARKLTSTDHCEEALQRYLWYHDHAREFSSGASINSGLSDWIELGRRYPKAKKALIEIRNQKTRKFMAGQGYYDLFSEVWAINRELQDEDATLALFKTIQQQDKELAGQCFGLVEGLLVQRGEYDVCLSYIGDFQANFESIRKSWERMKQWEDHTAEMRQQQSQRLQALAKTNSMFSPVPFSPPGPPKFADNNFVGQVRQLVEILVGTGHQADAEKIRGEAVTVLDDPRLKSAVSDAEQKTKK
jgi:serine/threonine protein kinase